INPFVGGSELGVDGFYPLTIVLGAILRQRDNRVNMADRLSRGITSPSCVQPHDRCSSAKPHMPLPYSREQFMRLIDSRRFSTEARLTELPTDFIYTHDSVQQWICRIRDGATKHHDDTSLVHICRALNQCMIATHERKQSVSCIQRPTFI
ncbi:hypothetical protein X801_08106, partial [Opisthorchis viverrini]